MNKLKQELLDYTGLLFACPMQGSVSTCAFTKMRELDVMERFEQWKVMSEGEKNDLISKHHICIRNREQGKCNSENITCVEKELK